MIVLEMHHLGSMRKIPAHFRAMFSLVWHQSQARLTHTYPFFRGKPGQETHSFSPKALEVQGQVLVSYYRTRHSLSFSCLLIKWHRLNCRIQFHKFKNPKIEKQIKTSLEKHTKLKSYNYRILKVEAQKLLRPALLSQSTEEETNSFTQNDSFAAKQRESQINMQMKTHCMPTNKEKQSHGCQQSSGFLTTVFCLPYLEASLWLLNDVRCSQ